MQGGMVFSPRQEKQKGISCFKSLHTPSFEISPTAGHSSRDNEGKQPGKGEVSTSLTFGTNTSKGFEPVVGLTTSEGSAGAEIAAAHHEYGALEPGCCLLQHDCTWLLRDLAWTPEALHSHCSKGALPRTHLSKGEKENRSVIKSYLYSSELAAAWGCYKQDSVP